MPEQTFPRCYIFIVLKYLFSLQREKKNILYGNTEMNIIISVLGICHSDVWRRRYVCACIYIHIHIPPHMGTQTA